MIDPVHNDIRTVSEINRLGGKYHGNCDFIRFVCRRLANLQLLNAIIQSDFVTGTTVNYGVERIQQEGVFIIMRDDLIVTVLKILFCGSGSRLQR